MKNVFARAAGLALAAGLIAPPALAEEASAGEHRPHVFITGHFTRPDSGRGTESEGTGAQLGYGHPLSKTGNWWLEGRFDYSTFETGAGRGTDFYQSTFGVDLQYAFGNREQFTPFLLLGLGYAHNDVVPDSEDGGSLALEGGAGLVARIGSLRWLRGRGDVRVISDQFQDGYLDYRLHAGIEIALGELAPKIIEVPVTVERVVIQEKLVPALDSDRDGVPDDFDACPGTLAGVRVDGKGCVVESQTLIVLRDVSFDFNSARLQLNGQRLLDDVVTFLNSQTELKAEIIGYADSVGPDSYNLKLSEARAASALQYLLGRGIAADRIISKGMGEANPVASNDTESGREANRRVEFSIIAPPATAPAPAPAPAPEAPPPAAAIPEPTPVAAPAIP